MAKLQDEHAELVEIVQRLRAVVALDTPPESGALQALRNELATAVITHLQAEDWLMYPGLLDSGDPALVEVARRFNAEMGSLARTFLDYCERWMPRSVIGNWTAFCHETRVITDLLVERIEREDRELYPLLKPLDRAA
ncbi:hemerythrin domain-containing protein [Novosphingobium sp. Gsoil 351]|uniref:hemerythrin domain-containing protein n=1 Tax=Novosphingobium sp. Gsoil 351 TaxID=2675225 RepID=UPI0018A7FC11|nr:hemerythrin domain-containing protein [Novosphingobium sp. Gsoil 351]